MALSLPIVVTGADGVDPALSVSLPAIIHDDIRKRRFKLSEYLIEKGINIIAFTSLAFIVLIFVFVFREAATIFTPRDSISHESIEEVETYGEEAVGESFKDMVSSSGLIEKEEHVSSFWDLFGPVWQPVSLQPKYGLLPLIVASLKVALISLLIAAPLAISAALFTSSFAPNWIKEMIKPVVEILAGFPSVVIGFFALVVLATVLQNVFGLQYRLNAFVGGVALAIAIMPVIFTISEDSLNAVPRSYVEASLALGAEKWETALFVVLPAAIPGIFAAILLGMGRAIGETMIVLMATGNAALATWSPFDPVRTMSATIGAEMAEVVFGDFHYSVLFFIGVVLFALSFTLNMVAETVVRGLVMRRFK